MIMHSKFVVICSLLFWGPLGLVITFSKNLLLCYHRFQKRVRIFWSTASMATTMTLCFTDQFAISW